jgi:hypothetical protein
MRQQGFSSSTSSHCAGIAAAAAAQPLLEQQRRQVSPVRTHRPTTAQSTQVQRSTSSQQTGPDLFSYFDLTGVCLLGEVGREEAGRALQRCCNRHDVWLTSTGH